jgi:hypothetical protein
MHEHRSVRKMGLAALATLALVSLGSGAAGAEDLDRSFAASSSGRLVIALEFGSVDVVRHDGDRIHLEAVSRGVGASGVRFAARSDGDDVYLESDAEPWVRWLQTAPRVRVRARVPRGVQVRVDAPSRVEVSGAELAGIAR